MPYKLREVSRGRYDDRGYSNEESIANLMLQKPAQINRMLTYTFGMDDDRFPLLFLTEGQGKKGTVSIKTETWTWPVMGRLKFNDHVVYFDSSNTTPGLGGAMFDVEFATHRLIEQWGLIAPDGVTQVRIMADLGEGAHGGHLYRLQLVNPDPTKYVNVSENLAVGKYWSLTAPTVPASYSKGNRSNSMGPGKMTSQLEYHRYSKEIGGNIANTIVEYEFKTPGGGTTNKWINEEMRQFEVTNRIVEEEKLWISQYNLNENGEIVLLDRDNGKPIRHTAGMMEICRESNYATYGETLSLNLIERTIGDVLDKDTDTGTMEVVLGCGKGFWQDFDAAMRDAATNNGFVDALGDKMIEEYDGGLSYGKYFRRYKTVDGHIITLKHLPFLDRGTLADNDRSNGRIHPRSGLPLTSHQAFLLDFSTYDGVQNVRMVRLEGQEHIVGILKGLTPIPPSWGVVPNNAISTEIDMSRYEVKSSVGLQVNNNRKMMQLKCVL